MSLKELLEETVTAAGTRLSPEVVSIIQSAAADLDTQGVGDKALKVGDTFPNGTFTTATGDTTSMSSILSNGPVIINFYRGGWCPYCNLELKAYQNLLEQIQHHGGQLVAISPEKPDNSLSTIEKNALEFPVLTDNENRFAKALGIAFELPEALQKLYGGAGMDLPSFNSGTGWSLPIPATFVVGVNGKIALSYVEREYTLRLEPSEAVGALALLNNE